MTRTLLLVGTRKGAFILDGGADRTGWSLSEPLCEGWPIHDLQWDATTGSIYAGGGSSWYGPAVFRSDDLGKTWTHSSEGMTYGDDGEKIPTVWNVTPAHGSIYAGVEPAGLFRSDDGGKTWTHVTALRDHPSRQDPGWSPGAGGLICHTIVPHPTDADRMWIAISAVGTFETTDGGADVGAAEQGRPGRLQPGPRAGDRPVRPQAGHGRRRARDALPAEPLRRLPLVRRRPDLGRGRHGAVVGVRLRRWPPIRATPRRAWVIPLSHPEEGRVVARRRARGVADARPRRHLGAPGRTACRRRTPTSASCARRCPRSRRPGRGLLRDEHRPALRLDRRGRAAGSGSPTTCRAIWGVQAIEVD